MIFIDAIQVEIRDGKVAHRPIYLALAVACEGRRDILGLWAGDPAATEAAAMERFLEFCSTSSSWSLRTCMTGTVLGTPANRNAGRGAAMDHQDVVRMLQAVSGLPATQAESAACTGLRRLAAGISKGEAADLLPRLTEPLRPCLHHEGPRERYQLDEFLQRLAQDLGSDRAVAERALKAVFAVLWRATGAKEYHDLASELPGDFQPLLDEAIELASAPPFEAKLPASRFGLDEFLDRIALNGVERDRARSAAEAVLMVLSMRITGGEVDDLIPLVPRELRVWMRRGLSRTGGLGSKMSLEEFLDEIARRSHVSRDEAADQARAVFAALHDVVGDKEFSDIVTQLPREYREALLEEQLS